MPRPRSLSLSIPSRPRTNTFLTDSFTPAHHPHTKQQPLLLPSQPDSTSVPKLANIRRSRYTPYCPSRLSLSSVPFSCGSGSDTGSSSEGEEMYGVRLRVKEANESLGDTALLIATRLSRLGLNKPFPYPPPRTKASVRFAHRRTQSLSVPPSYGFILLQQTPTIPRRPSAPNSSTTPTPTGTETSTPLIDIRTLTPSSPVRPLPVIPRRASFNRMMLVNPAVAAHLKKGGVVNMRTLDGIRRWRIRLPKEGAKEIGLGLEGLQEVVEGPGTALVG